jgi:hypothetical protein
MLKEAMMLRPRDDLSFWLLVSVLALFGLIVARLYLQLPPASYAASDLPVSADTCRSLPAFVRNSELGLSGDLLLATDSTQMGLTLQTHPTGAIYRHPTWDDAGFLGPLAYDQAGNIYTAPLPRLSLRDNPLVGATTIWRVDSDSAAMQPFAQLPGAAIERNPFGVMSLSYACDLDRLYAGSVIGSTPTDERGGVIAIDREDGTQMVVLDQVDVMSVLVVRQGAGYELYAGLARRPEVIALTLDADGNPQGEPRLLIDLTAAGADPSERARKLRLREDRLLVDLVPFNYSLQANASGVPQTRSASWVYDREQSTWIVAQASGTL